MARFESPAGWFGAGLVAGIAVAGACLALARARRLAPVPTRDADIAADSQLPDRAANDARDSMPPMQGTATEVFEYKGFVIHVFCTAAGGRYKAFCDIWESGAVVLENGGPATTYDTPREATAAAGAWARRWVQDNG